MNILNSLAPVFLLIALGAWLVQRNFLNKEILKGMNDLAYWIGLPSLIFYELATAEPAGEHVRPVLLVFFSGTAAAILVSLIWLRPLRLPLPSRGTFIQAAFRGNLAFIGLPVVIFAFAGLEGVDPERTRGAAVLALAPIMVVYNIVSVFALYASQATGTGRLLLKTGRQLVTNPLILASVAGFFFAVADLALPPALDRSVEALSRIALPLALLCIGGSLVLVPVRGRIGSALTAAMVKVAISPLAGAGIGLVAGIEHDLMLVALIYLACPTAAASYVLARQLGGDEALAASTVVVSTLLSMLSLSAVVALL